jgi:uncharacterized membrane protein YeaQ/YmgE (transglycosylase-associated protein family)
MRYPSPALDGFDALRSHPTRWLFRQFTVYLVAAAIAAAALVAGAAMYAYLGAPANPPASLPLLIWILLGLISGFIANKIFSGTGQEILMDIVLGIVGAVVGGYLFLSVGGTGITGFNHYSIFVAVAGAIVLLWVYHAIAGRQ